MISTVSSHNLRKQPANKARPVGPIENGEKDNFIAPSLSRGVILSWRFQLKTDAIKRPFIRVF